MTIAEVHEALKRAADLLESMAESANADEAETMEEYVTAIDELRRELERDVGA